MAEDLIETFTNFVALTLELSDLTAQLMPLGLALLEFLFGLFFFLFYLFVLFEEPGYFVLQFFYRFHEKISRIDREISLNS